MRYQFQTREGLVNGIRGDAAPTTPDVRGMLTSCWDGAHKTEPKKKYELLPARTNDGRVVGNVVDSLTACCPY